MIEDQEYTHQECPFCAEEIKIDAKKCKHCGEFLDPVMRARREKKDKPIIVHNTAVANATAKSSTSGCTWGCLLLIILIIPCCYLSGGSLEEARERARKKDAADKKAAQIRNEEKKQKLNQE